MGIADAVAKYILVLIIIISFLLGTGFGLFVNWLI